MGENRVLGIVPIRSGSKGIPDKNILPINGIPLFYYMTKALCDSERVDRVVIYTDSLKYAHEVLKYFGTNVDICFRSKESAEDVATTEEAIIEYIHIYKPEEEYILLGQATSPVVTSEQVDAFIDNLLSDKKYNSSLSVVDISERFLWNEKGESINYDMNNRKRRQDIKRNERLFVENGALYLSLKQDWVNSNNRLTKPVKLFEMPGESLFEVDSLHDIAIVSGILKGDF